MVFRIWAKLPYNLTATARSYLERISRKHGVCGIPDLRTGKVYRRNASHMFLIKCIKGSRLIIGRQETMRLRCFKGVKRDDSYGRLPGRVKSRQILDGI